MIMLSIYLFAFMICGALSENINSDVLRLYADNDNNRQEIKDLKQAFRILTQEVSALKEENENAENDVRNLVRKVAVLEEKNKNAEEEMKKLQKKVDFMGATGRTTNKPATTLGVVTTNKPVTTRGVVTTSKPVTTRKVATTSKSFPTPGVVTTPETTTPGTNAEALWFGGKRYIALASSSDYVIKATAKAKCHNIGGNLANLYNRAHMNKIIKYVRQNKLNGDSYKYFHLGMTYDPINQILRLRDGTRVSVSDYKWFPGLPRNGASYASYTNMVIGISSDPSSKRQYLHNYQDYYRYVLCEL